MEFGDFDFPTRGENLLGKVEFTPQQLYSTGKQMEELFWLPTEPIWLTISTQLQVFLFSSSQGVMINLCGDKHHSLLITLLSCL